MPSTSKTEPQLTDAQLIFARRMLPHFMAGKSAKDAARAVIDDDARLFSALLDRSHSYYVPTADERGASRSSDERPGDLIASNLSAATYSRLRLLPVEA